MRRTVGASHQNVKRCVLARVDQSINRNREDGTMAEKAKTHRTEHTATESMAEMSDRARRTGQRVQYEAGQWWNRMLAQSADWQKQVTNFASLTNRMIPLAQERMEDAMTL